MLKPFRFWIGIVISLICLYFAFQGIQFNELFAALRYINYAWLVVASLLFLVSYSGRVFRWRLLFSPLKLRLRKIFNVLNIGYFLSNLLPARIGDVARAYLIGEVEGVSKMRAVSTIIVERISDGLAVVLLLAITALFISDIPDLARQSAVVTAFGGIGAILFLLLLSLHKERGVNWLKHITALIPFLRNPKLWSALESLIDGFLVLRSPRAVVGVSAWALFAWIVGGVMYWIVMRAMNLNLPIAAAFLVMTVTSLAAVVPSSPGYVGVFHIIAQLTLTMFGVDKSLALSYAIVMHAFTYLWLIALGIFSIWDEGLSYETLRTIELKGTELVDVPPQWELYKEDMRTEDQGSRQLNPFFAYDQVRQWRLLSQVEDWGITTPIKNPKAHQLLASLNPSFIPDEEPLIFYAGIYSGWLGPSIRIIGLEYQGKALRAGSMRATDRRLIFMATDKGIIFQVPYEAIKNIYTENDIYTLVLLDNSELMLRLKVPRPSLLGALAVLGGSPIDRATISRMERDKEEIARNFTSLFVGFFMEIVDENRRRRQS